VSLHRPAIKGNGNCRPAGRRKTGRCATSGNVVSGGEVDIEDHVSSGKQFYVRGKAIICLMVCKLRQLVLLARRRRGRRRKRRRGVYIDSDRTSHWT
jgi:hypothetical protein